MTGPIFINILLLMCGADTDPAFVIPVFDPGDMKGGKSIPWYFQGQQRSALGSLTGYMWERCTTDQEFDCRLQKEEDVISLRTLQQHLFYAIAGEAQFLQHHHALTQAPTNGISFQQGWRLSADEIPHVAARLSIGIFQIFFIQLSPHCQVNLPSPSAQIVSIL